MLSSPFSRWSCRSLLQGKDEKEGFGKAIYEDGSIYEGVWRKNLWHGFGKRTWGQGQTYYGSYQDGKKVGEWIENDYFCVTYINLGPDTPRETLDFYFDRCGPTGGETFYEDGVCVRGCTPEQ